MGVNFSRPPPHRLRLCTFSSPTPTSKTRTIHVQGTDSRCQNAIDLVLRRICLLKRPAFQNPRGHSSVNYPRHATTIRRLWEVPARWNRIIRPAMLMSVPPRAAIAFSLRFDSLIWCVHPHAFLLCFPSCSRLPAPNRVPRSYRRNQERPRGTYREWFVPVRMPAWSHAVAHSLRALT